MVVEGMFLLIDVLLTEAYWYVVYDTGDCPIW